MAVTLIVFSISFLKLTYQMKNVNNLKLKTKTLLDQNKIINISKVQEFIVNIFLIPLNFNNKKHDVFHVNF
jgi:hypothetical protein